MKAKAATKKTKSLVDLITSHDDEADTIAKRPASADDDDDTSMMTKPAYTAELALWKSKKWASDRMLVNELGDGGEEFPDHLKQMYTEAQKISGGGKRQRVKNIVEQCIEPCPGQPGKYRLCVEKPFCSRVSFSHRDKLRIG